MQRIHFTQQSFTLSDPAMEAALPDMPVFREFARHEAWDWLRPDECTIPQFQQVLEKHKSAAQSLQTVNHLKSAKRVTMKRGTVMEATLIAAPRSTKSGRGECDPEMKRSRLGQQSYVGLKCYIPQKANQACSRQVMAPSAH